MRKNMNGIIVIDKPKGWTSFDVVAKMRRLCKTKKVGHGGTLDPMATGILPILIGTATKFQSLLQDSDKEYLAEFKLGITTDTEDITGKILTSKLVEVELADINNVLANFVGEISQVPPMYSAIKKDGERLYELARKGKIIERKPRIVSIKSIKLIEFNKPDNIVKILVACSKGTYIRTLCSDIGAALGCGATLTALRRTKACSFSLDDCISISEAESLSENGSISDKLISISESLKNYRKIFITDAQATRFNNGGFLDLNRLRLDAPTDKEYLQVFCNDSFIGLGIVNLQKNQLNVFKLIKE